MKKMKKKNQNSAQHMKIVVKEGTYFIVALLGSVTQ